MQRKIYIQNTPWQEALQQFTDRLEELQWFSEKNESVSVEESLGRISYAPVYARRSAPHYIAAAMDGIAVLAQDTYGASEVSPIFLSNDQYQAVDTGDPIPSQFNAVIMIEEVNFAEDKARLIKAAVPWQHIRSIGEDLVEDDMVIPGHTQIGPCEQASFLTAAVEQVAVFPHTTVGIIPTGTELVEKGENQMAPGAIVESNSHMLAGLCADWGAKTIRHPIAADDRDLIKQAVLSMKDRCDLLVICSGSSTGTEDYTASIIQELGEVIVHGLATRPGKPAILGIIDGKPVIGLPGYPISAHLIFNLFARPILYRKMGKVLPHEEILTCSAARKLPSHMGIDEFIHVQVAPLGNEYIAYPLNRGAGISSVLVKSDGIMQIPRGIEGLNPGEPCQIQLTRSLDIINQTLLCVGSHDLTLDYLTDLLIRKHGLRMVSSNAGSMGGIMALTRGQTHMAGIHLLDENSGDYNKSFLQKFLPGQDYVLLHLVKRQQGLILQKGNPLQIKGIQDLIRPEIRFINRQKGSGTRVLADYLFKKEGISPTQIDGYSREEFTHLAVAAAVKNDGCDAGLGIYAAARVMGLDFIPIEMEQYDLCIIPEKMPAGSFDCLLDCIRSDEFGKWVNAAGGYDTSDTGKIVS